MVKVPECTGNVAVLGYCLGALMTFLTAVRYAVVDAGVAYHGGDTEKYLSEIDGLHAPLLMHLGEEDEFISMHKPRSGGASQKAQRNRVQLPGSASRLLSA